MADLIRMVHPKTGGVAQSSIEGFELAHKSKGWRLITDEDALAEIPEDRLRDAAANWDIDLIGADGEDEVRARVLKDSRRVAGLSDGNDDGEETAADASTSSTTGAPAATTASDDAATTKAGAATTKKGA